MSLKWLRDRIIELKFEGTILTLDHDAEIKPGDFYIAERNTGIKFLTCRKHNLDTRCVFPVELAYVFDTGECAKVIKIDGELI